MMKKISLLAALGLLVLAACTKDPLPAEQPEPVVGKPAFTATTETAVTKTALSGSDAEGYSVLWQNGDRIMIADAAGHAGEYSTNSTEEKGDFAFVSGSGTESVTGPYRAWYPAILYNGGTPSLPVEQHYTTNNIVESPMYASGGSRSLEFKNLCGIVRLNLSTDDDVMVKSVKLHADQGMSGAYTISSDAAVISSGTAGVTLDCGGGVAVGGESVPFHIAVPAGTYTNLSITVTTTAGARQTRISKSGIKVTRSRITEITLPFNSLDQVPTDLSAKATANTYIVPAAGAYKFKATVKGNGGLDPLTGTTATTIDPAGIAGVKVLWELYGQGRAVRYGDEGYDIWYSDGYVYFTTPEVFVPGDACVAIYDSSGNVLWSWVIWATPTPGMVMYNGNYFMDRNLGGIEVGNCMRGFLYQWGRKDAFSAANGGYEVYPYVPVASSVFDWVRGLQSMDYTVAHPTTWIRYPSGSSSGTWTNEDVSKKLWRADEKTIYDPCPAGWRVPTKENISGISGLPATGIGGGYDPSEYYQGFGNPGIGYYWTASTNGGSDDYAYAFCNDGRNIQHWSQGEGYAIRPVEDVATRDLADYTDLSANGTANSYVIHEPGKYRFKATVKGNGGGNAYSGISQTTAANTISSATVLWSSYGNLNTPAANSFISHIFYMDEYVCFVTNVVFAEGNAGVAIMNSSNQILWSWHIWFESDDLDALAQAWPGGPVFMDRNLGATSNAYENDTDTYDYGLIYQWGRKDPFMNKGMFRSNTSNTDPPYRVAGRDHILMNGRMSVAQSILSPTQYAMTGESRWTEDSQQGKDNLWQSNKTIFDPCPPGWKVPVQLDIADDFMEALFAQDYNENGYSVSLPDSEQAWLPAASYRPGSSILYYYQGGNYQTLSNEYAQSYQLHSGVLHQWLVNGAFGWRRLRVKPDYSWIDQDWKGLYNLDQDMNIGNPTQTTEYTTGMKVLRSALYSVRCVREDSQRTVPESVSLNITSQTVYVGDQLQLVATVSPSDAVRKGVTWTIEAGGGVSVDQNGLVTVLERVPPDYVSATVKATTYNGKTASCVLTIQKPAFTAVDLGLPSGKKWANMNIGATTPHEVGYYIAWGETNKKSSGQQYEWSNYKYGTGQTALTKYNSTDQIQVLELSDDAARYLRSSPWRTPTVAEWQELFNYNYTNWEWVTRSYLGFSVSGYLVTSKANGNWIFLPATGYKYGSSNVANGDQGMYMTSNVEKYGLYPYAYASYFSLTSSEQLKRTWIRCNGLAIRAIQD